MGFLTPLFLIALAGLAVPVLIHLTRQEKGKPLRFPSLMFLKRIPFEETSRRRIRHWLLLVMRLAALGAPRRSLRAPLCARRCPRLGGRTQAGRGGHPAGPLLLHGPGGQLGAGHRPREGCCRGAQAAGPRLARHLFRNAAPAAPLDQRPGPRRGHPGHAPHRLPGHAYRAGREAGPFDPRGLRAAPPARRGHQRLPAHRVAPGSGRDASRRGDDRAGDHR